MLESTISCVRNQHFTSAPQLFDTNSCFSDLSDSLNSLNSLKAPFYLVKIPIE